jgi:ppGpp synthetase/RelA/SpoT-type nucleotidyltranferase
MMRLDEYEKGYATTYADFAETIRFILENAIGEANGVPRPQSIQCRAKSAASLRPKLQQRGLIESESIETEIKDLAGARLIFYTNTDVDRFLNSRLIFDNFDVDRDATKIHHPIKENEGRRYQAIHYTVRMSEERAKLPEYARFKAMRCEIQIQTILNHAWSETSHDIIYKDKPSEGFGAKAMNSITNRFNQIMDKYLLPAGYEFQRVQHDYERLQQGKELFDRDAIRSLEEAKNNNERYELLTSLREYVLPNYDDIAAIFGDLHGPLVVAAKASRTTPIEAIKTPFGELPGRTAANVTTIIVDIFDTLRYVDIAHTFAALCEIYREEPDSDVRKRILTTIEHLAHYDLDVWRSVGPQVQLTLVTTIERMEAGERMAARSPLIVVWRKLLDSGITGTSWVADSVTLRSGALPVSDELKSIRDKAMSGLLDLFGQSTAESQKREVMSALRQATRVPTQAEYSSGLLALTLVDAKRIVHYSTEHAVHQPYALLEHLEHDYLWDWHRARGIAQDEQDRFGCRALAEDLIASIQAFRDKVNDDQQFVRYKTLVGFESVFPPHWENESFNFDASEKYRRKRVAEYIEAISDATEDEWYRFVEGCAATESNDMMTFPVFGEFLNRLAVAKPLVAVRFLERADDNVLRFLPAFLNGLRDGSAKKEYRAVLTGYLATGKHLVAIAHHFRNAKTILLASLKKVLKHAISADDDIAVMECLVLAVERHDPRGNRLVEHLFVPAIKYLMRRKDTRWVNGVWFLQGGSAFFSGLSSVQAKLVLHSLLSLSRIEHHAETIIVYIAESYPEAVWQFFQRRLDEKREDEEERYEAVPHQFHGLEQPLASDVELAVGTVRSWFRADDRLFQYTGGRLLAAVFPSCPEPFARKLADIGVDGSDEDIAFVFAVLRNFSGEPAMHLALKALVNRLPEDDPRLGEAEICLQSSGVVGGEFGFVEAFRRKKEEIAPWLADPRPRVKAFASKYVRNLDLRIAAEQRSSEQRREQRKRDFDADDSD